MSSTSTTDSFYETILESYLVSMARTVESAVARAFEALCSRKEEVAGSVFITEPRINEIEIIIDNHAVRMFRGGHLPEDDIRHVVATLKINNDLERMGDLAVNICQRAISLARMPSVEPPDELGDMVGSVRAMVGKCLGALSHRNLTLATQVLEEEAAVDSFRDRIFEQLPAGMKQDKSLVAPNLQCILATRNIERIADHTTNIAEDVVFWLRGVDIRHNSAASRNLLKNQVSDE